MIVTDPHTLLASRPEPGPEPDPSPPRPLTTEIKQVETVDNDYTGFLLQAVSP